MKILLACFVCLTALVTEAQQILTNPGFETPYASGIANGWTKSTAGGAGMTCSQEASNVHGGGSAQKIVTTGMGGANAQALLNQNYTLGQGVVYRASVWVRADAAGRHFKLYLRDTESGANNQQGALYTLTVGTAWQQVVINGGWKWPDTHATFTISCEDNGTYWVDDASLTDVTTEYLNAPLQNACVATPSTLIGLSINKLMSDNWPPIHQGLIRLWDTGTQWRQIEGSSNSFSWGRLDSWVNFVTTNDPTCNIMYTLGQTPTWASSNTNGVTGTTGVGANYPPTSMTDWSNYVFQVANRYKGKIKYFEVWNEWDFNGFYAGSIGDLVTMTGLAKRVITNVDAGNKLVAPVVTIAGFSKLEQFIQQGGSQYADIYAYHDYPTSIPEQCLPGTVGIKDMLVHNGINAPVWVTEGSPDVQMVGESANASRGIASRLYLYFWTQNVQSYDWYTWDLAFIGNPQNTNKVPLGGPGNVAGPGGAGVNMLATNWLAGAQAISKAADSNGTWQFKVQKPSNPPNYIVWNPYSNAVFNIPASWSIYRQRDLLNNTTSLAGITTITSSITPVILDSAGVVTCSAITVRPALLAPATVGTVYNQFHSATGGMAPYTFTGDNLPPGFTLSSGGALSGTPTNSGNLTFSVVATDSNGCTGTNRYTLAANCPPITIGPAILAAGVVGAAYNQTNTAVGGTLPYTFSVSGGSLPPDFTLSNDGFISGTPTNFGNYEFTIAATDAYGCFSSQDYSMMVEGAPVITGQPQSQTVKVGGGVALTVLAGGLPEPEFQWYFNSADISGATNATMTISNFQTSDQGGYYLLASNEQGSVTSEFAQLYLAEPLRFLDPSVNSDGSFHALVIGSVETNFVVDGSTDLINWIPLATNPAPFGILDFTDTNLNSSAPSFRFYRAWLSP